MLPVAVSTARCHLPSVTGLVDRSGWRCRVQNSALRSPPLADVQRGVYWPAVELAVIGSAEELKMTPPVPVVLNQALSDW